ncbi:MAG: efflux RND transporter periplasmic adaptor subunit [Steroidobacterales bacterium]
MQSIDTGRALQRAAAAVAIILLLAFLIVHFTKSHTEHALARETRAAATAAPTVDVVVVHNTAAAGTLTLPGETAAWYESIIYARVSGYVAKWYVDIGDHVKAGQLLATIDTPELDAELAAAQAKLQVARAQVKVKLADAAFANSTYARWRDSPKGVVSEQEREDKKAGDATAAAELEAARAQVNLDQADVDRLSAFEQFKRVTAPYAGTIIERRVDIGNLVTAGSAASTTSLYRMAQDDPLRVFVDVPQSAAADLMKVGVPAQISSNDLTGQTISGTITRTSNAINPQARTFRVEVDIPNSDRRLVPGMYVQVGFQLQNSGMSQVPAAALIFKAGGPKVAVVNSDGTVRFRDVTIGRDDGDRVELSSGVSNDERLVLNISNQIVDGQKVRVNDDERPVSGVAMRAH